MPSALDPFVMFTGVRGEPVYVDCRAVDVVTEGTGMKNMSDAVPCTIIHVSGMAVCVNESVAAVIVAVNTRRNSI